MYCALQRTKSDTQKVSEEGKESLSRKFQEQFNFSTSLEVKFFFFKLTDLGVHLGALSFVE